MTATFPIVEVLEARLAALAVRLGYSDDLVARGPPAVRPAAQIYYTSWARYDRSSYRHVVRQAFDLIKVHSVFGFQRAGTSDAQGPFTPLVYLAAAPTPEDALQIHRQVWSQGVVPILLLATPEGLEVRSSLGPPPKKPVVLDWAEVEGQGDLPSALHRLTRVSLASSIAWSDFAVERRHRVDSSLLNAIRLLSAGVLVRYPALEKEVHLVNAVIGRFLYLYILLDRKVISLDWIAGRQDCATIAHALRHDPVGETVWPAAEVWALFDAIDGAMNGSIFLVSKTDRKRLDADLLHLVRRAIRHADEVGPEARQPGFFEVEFRTLRTETLSAIYELFLHLEDPEQKQDDGAFYTPPFLVDYVLDELDRLKPLTTGARVLDPAAGSGAFLVGAYRRILERSLRTGGLSALPEMKAILIDCIFGIEKNGQAASVARFSLYLTMLDYLEGVGIDEFHAATTPDKVFPDLASNVVTADVFDDAARPNGKTARFSHVVGNPPWTSYGEARSRIAGSVSENPNREAELERARGYADVLAEEKNRYPVSNFRLSELFVWKISRDLLDTAGVTALLLPVRSFVSRSASAFPAAVLREFQLLGVANLTHFRYKLFENARTPAAALFARQGASAPLDVAWIYAPQLSSQAISGHGDLWSIIVSPNDITSVRIRDLARNEDAWFQHLMLRPLDRRYAKRFELWREETGKTFGAFLKRNGLRMARGGTPGETGVDARHIQNKSTGVLSRDLWTPVGPPPWALPMAELAKAKGVYRHLFAGNVVLVPRSAETAAHIDYPLAFNSSFNAIARVDGGDADPEGMAGLAAFLRSSLVRYLGALHGRTWIMDRLRLETGDLVKLPFPFDGLDDVGLKAMGQGEASDIVDLFAQMMGLDAGFADIVAEYDEFRIGYEDAQMPGDVYSEPDLEMVQAYEAALAKELGSAFGPDHAFVAATRTPRGGSAFRIMRVAPSQLVARSVNNVDDVETFAPLSFTPSADISVDEHGFILSKPNARGAWTLEQAHSDAGVIVQLVAAA